MLDAREQRLLDALEPVAAAHGVEIVTVAIVGSKKAPTIRVYIDTDHGVGFEELSSSQAWISDLMDEIDPFPGAYTLEVSSPGIDRPLRTPAHFAKAIGEEAVVKTVEAIDGRSRFTGTIVSADEVGIALEIDGEEVGLAYPIIKSAHVKGVIDFGK